MSWQKCLNGSIVNILKYSFDMTDTIAIIYINNNKYALFKL